MKIDNRSCERFVEFKYLGITLNKSKFYSGRNSDQIELREC
jgi:hypothetical protein